MPIDKDFSVKDEAYLTSIGVEPKMTMDEVGADIGEHGFVPVTPETATQDPFSAKGSLANALDEDVLGEESVEHTKDDLRDETNGEVEGTTSTPQGLIQPVETNKADEGAEPTIQQDKAVCVKDSLSEALDAITMDGAEEIDAKPTVGKDPEPDYSKYSEEDGSHVPLKAPEIPTSMGGDEDKPDENGLVYVSATFTVDPDKYVSNNYRPANMGKMPDAAALLKQKSMAMKAKAANPEEEAAISDLGTPEAKEAAASPDEPTEQQEEAAAKEADKEQKKEQEAAGGEEKKQIIPTAKGDKTAADEAPESVVLDYATFIDGSSFMCFDEVGEIDYTKIAMDAGPKKPPTRENCQTTFAQCRAKNPLFCRFHGPKLLEADIKGAIKATVGPGCVVQVTKDKNSKNKFTFRLTVGCPPSKKKMVEKMVHMYLTQNPGISSSTEDWNLVGKHKQTTEFEMDILQADKPPKKDTIAAKALINTKMAKKMNKEQSVVGKTAPALEKKAAKGQKWETVDEAVESEWEDLVDKNVHKSLLGNNGEFLHNFDEIANQFDEAHDKGDAEGLKKALEALKAEIGKYDKNGQKKPEAATEAAETQETTEEPAAPETPQTQAEEPNVESGIEDEQIIEYYDGHGKLTSKPIAEASETEKMLAYNKLLLDAADSGAFDNEEDHKKYDYFYNINHNLHPIEKTINEMKGWISGVKKKGGETGGGDTVVLPAPKAGSSGKVAESSHPHPKDNVKQTPNNKANEHSSKLSNFKTQLDGMIENGADAESVNTIKDLLLGAQTTYDKLSAQYEDIAALDAKYAAVDDENDASGMDKNFKKMLIDDAKSMAEGKANQLLAELESKVGGIESALAKAGEKAMDVKKGKVADDVEETIKGLAAYVYGGKRPPQGVDSVTDYLDYKKEEMESAAEGSSVSPEEMAKMADTYHLNESYDATKAASNAMDAAVAEFKDLMDSTPEQGEDNESYMNKVEEAQKKIKSASSELMANFDAYKQALEKCKYDVEAAKKLAESKKKLEGGGIDGEGGGEVTKADLEDFFDSKFADNDQESLNNWLELANHGTWEGKSPNNFFNTFGGVYQKLMEKKGADHPVTKALVKAGLNFPKRMEQKKEVAENVEESKPGKQNLSDEQKKAIIAAMSPKQKLEAAVKIFKKKLASNPNDAVAKDKLAKYEAMLSKLSK